MENSSSSALYSEAAFLVCLVTGRTCRLKTAIYEHEFTSDKRALYALAHKSLLKYQLLSLAIEHSGLPITNQKQRHVTRGARNQRGCSHCFLLVVAHDALLGSRGSKHHVIMRHLRGATGDSLALSKLRRGLASAKKSNPDTTAQGVDQSASPIQLPCYARVNRLLTSLDQTREALYAQGFQEVHYNPSATSYKRFRKMVSRLETKQFMLDYHLPDAILVFPPGSSLHQLELVQSHHLVIQDKASCIPPTLLLPGIKGDVLDACSAPGNKASQLAERLSESSTLFCVERDPRRYRRLCTTLKANGITHLTLSDPIDGLCLVDENDTTPQPRVKAICTDFLTIDPTDQEFRNVQAILLDPSCSGSGLVGRQPDGETPPSSTTWNDCDLVNEEAAHRLQRLSNLQAQLLRHALSFPSVQQVVYSTCSLYKQENELVVRENCDRFASHFRLEPIWAATRDGHTLWPNRGIPELDCAACLRATPEADLTNGFFVANFVRISGTPSDGSFVREKKRRPLRKKHKCSR